MADKIFILDVGVTGLTLDARIQQDATGYLLDEADGLFRATPADKWFAVTEDSEVKGRYKVTISTAFSADGFYTAFFTRRIGASPDAAVDTYLGGVQMYVVSDAEVPVSAGIAALPGSLILSLETAGVAASLVTVLDNAPLEYIRGDVKAISFAFGSAWAKAGSRVWFCVKETPTGAELLDKECTITDAANMTGSVTPAATDLATVGSFYAEFERRDSDGTSNPVTIWQGKLIVRQDVRQS